MCPLYRAFVLYAPNRCIFIFHVAHERRCGRVVREARLWRRKSPYRVSSRLGLATRRLENCQTSRKWVPFSNKGRIRQRKEKDVLYLSSAVPKIQWDSNPTAPTAIRLWDTYSFLTCLSHSLTDTSSLKYCLKEPLNHNQPTSHCRMHT